MLAGPRSCRRFLHTFLNAFLHSIRHSIRHSILDRGVGVIAGLATLALACQSLISSTIPATAWAAPGPAAAGAIATPILAGQASSSGYPAGIAIFDSATLGQAVNPTGTITFRLFGPGDGTCAGPVLFTTQTTVAGNGYYQSISFPTVLAGIYRWVASYGGDANNASASTACSDSSAAVGVSKRSPTLDAAASVVSSGAALGDAATLGSGSGPTGPTGTMTFTVFGPANMVCSGSPVFTAVKTVNGNGVYQTDPFTPTAAGTYQWIALYSGDANNNAASTTCSYAAQAVTFSPPTPTTTVPPTTTTTKPPPTTTTVPPTTTTTRPPPTTTTVPPTTTTVPPTTTTVPPTTTTTVPPTTTTTRPPTTTTTVPPTTTTVPLTTTTTKPPPTTTTVPPTTTTVPPTTTTTKPPPTTTTVPPTTTTTRPPTTTTTVPPTTTTVPPTTTTTKPPPTTTTVPPTTTTTKPPPTTTTTTTLVPPGPTQTERFVQRSYGDLLGRPPSGAESAFWVNVLAGGFSRDNMGAILTTTVEFRRRIVASYYQTFLGRAPDPATLDAFVKAIDDGWTLEYVATALVGSDEFYVAHGASPGTYVDALYGTVLGLAPDPSGRSFWVGQLNQGTDRYTVALAFLTSGVAHHNVVALAYSWLLHHSPDAAGMSFWSSQLDGGLRQEYVYAFFVGSSEYWAAS